MKPSMRHFSLGIAFLICKIGQVTAIKDADRLGVYLTGIPIYRTRGNTNVVQVSMDGQNLNLTLSSSSNYVLVASPDCTDCIRDTEPYDPSRSSTWTSTSTALDYKFDNPYAHPGPRTAQQADDVDSPQSPTVIDVDAVVGTERIQDPRGDPEERRIAVVQRMTDAAGSNSVARFERGSSGIWGLGIDENSPADSIISAVKNSQGASNFTVGLAMSPWSSDLHSMAGELHWGAVPHNAYEGAFNWIKTSGEGQFWSIPVDKLSMNGHGSSGKGLATIIDPGYNVIAIPFDKAQELYSHVKGAMPHADYPNRWIIPCDSQISFSIRIKSQTYNVPAESLIQKRTDKECWGSVVSWAVGTAPDQAGRLYLGIPFLAHFYTVLYYENPDSYVGIAGKPGGKTMPTRNDNQRLSSSAIGVISAVVIVVVFGLLGCYYRQRTSPAGWHHRSMRRQHRAAVNQMKTVNPLAPTPHLLIGPPPMLDMPRTQVYSKPFFKGFASRNRAEGMMVDPNVMAFQQQQEQLMAQQQEQSGDRQESHRHHRHPHSGHHHRDNQEEPQIGFFGKIRSFFGGAGSPEHGDHDPSRHQNHRDEHHHERHHSNRTTPRPSRAHSTVSRHHRDTTRGSYDEGTHSFSGFEADGSYHQSHPNPYIQHPIPGPVQNQWGHAPPMPHGNQLFFDPAGHHQHMGGPMIHNGAHQAYEQQHMPPYYSAPR